MKERPAIKMRLMILLIAVLMEYTSSSCPSNCPEAPYHITQPSTDNVQIVSPNATSLNLGCSLNVTIPAGIMITWSLNGDVLNTLTIPEDLNTDTILYFGGTPQSGVYQCLFNDSAGYILRGNITVIVIDIVQPSMDFHTVTFNESTISVQLRCSLNINISSDITVTWLHNDTIIMISNNVTKTGATTTLLIENVQPSNAGIYQCMFNNTVDRWILTRNIGLSPYYIIQPSTNNFTQTVFYTAPTVTLRCSLNVNIPASMTVTWLHGNKTVPSSRIITQVDQTTTLQLSSFQDGIYQCIFSDAVGYILSRSVTLVVIDIVQPSGDDVITVTFDESESSVQLMCSLNIKIPSNVTVTWLHNMRVVMRSQHNENSNTTTSTLIIRNPQSNVGDYMCVFTDIANELTLSRNIVLQELSVTNTATRSMFDPTSTSAGSTFAAVTPARTNTKLIATITSSTSTFITATSALGTTTIPPTTTDATDKASSSSDINIGVIVAPIIIIIVITLIVIALIIVFYWWKRRKQLNNTYDNTINLKAENPYYSTVKSVEKSKNNEAHVTEYTANINQEPLPMYAVPDKQKKEKRESKELHRSSVDFSYKPQSSPEISVRSKQQTLSLITPDNEYDMELDIYATPGIPERTEASTIFDNEDDENPIYSEAIDPTLLVGSVLYESISDNDSLCPYASIYADPLPLLKSEGPPIVSTKNIEPLNQLGTGQFGEVILANTVGLSYQHLGIGNSDDTTISLKVAVKTLKASPSDDVQKAFEKEIKFMSRLKDDNVIRLLGICTTGTPFIMMEYMENGDLHNYLQQFNFTTKTENPSAANEIRLDALVYMSYQIASGMNYLSSCKFIHRDLAARNVLVGADNAIKIADFGMSQNLYSAYYYKISGRICLPIRWMAYECFFGKFSVKTDVWAFGITLWEIFTLCRLQPFNEFSDKELIQDATKGAKRKIPYQPNICPNDIYIIMKSCFHHEPSERAGFNVLHDQLNECYSNFIAKYTTAD